MSRIEKKESKTKQTRPRSEQQNFRKQAADTNTIPSMFGPPLTEQEKMKLLEVSKANKAFSDHLSLDLLPPVLPQAFSPPLVSGPPRKITDFREQLRFLNWNFTIQANNPKTWHGEESTLNGLREEIERITTHLPFSDAWPHLPNEACIQVFYLQLFDFWFKNNGQTGKEDLLIVPEYVPVGVKWTKETGRPDIVLGHGSMNGFVERPRVIIELKRDLQASQTKVMEQTGKYLETFQKIKNETRGTKNLVCIALDLNQAWIQWIKDVEDNNNTIEHFLLEWDFKDSIVKLLRTKQDEIRDYNSKLGQFYALLHFIGQVVKTQDVEEKKEPENDTIEEEGVMQIESTFYGEDDPDDDDNVIPYDEHDPYGEHDPNDEHDPYDEDNLFKASS